MYDDEHTIHGIYVCVGAIGLSLAYFEPHLHRARCITRCNMHLLPSHIACTVVINVQQVVHKADATADTRLRTSNSIFDDALRVVVVVQTLCEIL
jgi:hypothetical protein